MANKGKSNKGASLTLKGNNINHVTTNHGTIHFVNPSEPNNQGQNEEINHLKWLLSERDKDINGAAQEIKHLKRLLLEKDQTIQNKEDIISLLRGTTPRMS